MTEHQVDICAHNYDQKTHQDFRIRIRHPLIWDDNKTLQEAPLEAKIDSITERVCTLIQSCPALRYLNLSFYGCIPLFKYFGEYGVKMLVGRKIKRVDVHPFSGGPAGEIRKALAEDTSSDEEIECRFLAD